MTKSVNDYELLPGPLGRVTSHIATFNSVSVVFVVIANFFTLLDNYMNHTNNFKSN
jgi:lipopolysaccharide biosynthesis protein